MSRTGRPVRADRSTVADVTLAIRLTAIDRQVLDELIRLHQEEVGPSARVSQGSYIRGLIYAAANAKGVSTSPAEPPAAPERASPKARAPTKSRRA